MMVHQFLNFQVDELRRQVRVRQQSLELQPRVFDLLVYLARHRDRVVPKDELLDAVWAGVMVADGSLQRAASLARSAFAGAGVTGALETYPRYGYRLVDVAEDVPSPPVNPLPDGSKPEEDWSDLCDQDLLARTFRSCLDGETTAALQHLEDAFTARQAAGFTRPAAAVAIALGHLRFERRESALAAGWRHRAARLLADQSPGSDHGQLAWLESRMALMADEPIETIEAAERCLAIGERHGDADLQALGLLGIGEGRMMQGKVREGFAALDEAGVAAGGGGLSPWASALVYCGLIYFCMARCEWQRAAEWTAQFTRWTNETGGAAYPGLCRLHRTEVLALRGDIAQAKAEAREARLMLARQNPWMEGAAWAQEGEIALTVGDFSGAREAFNSAWEVEWDSRFELALLTLFEGDAAGAAKELNRLREEDAWSYRVRRGRALAYHVMATAQAGDLETARARLTDFENDEEVLNPPAMQGLLKLAQAEVAVALERPSEAGQLLREAVGIWVDLGTPLMAAHTRCRLSQVLIRHGDEAGAQTEHKAACAIFQRVEAPLAQARCRSRFAAARRGVGGD